MYKNSVFLPAGGPLRERRGRSQYSSSLPGARCGTAADAANILPPCRRPAAGASRTQPIFFLPAGGPLRERRGRSQYSSFLPEARCGGVAGAANILLPCGGPAGGPSRPQPIFFLPAGGPLRERRGRSQYSSSLPEARCGSVADAANILPPCRRPAAGASRTQPISSSPPESVAEAYLRPRSSQAHSSSEPASPVTPHAQFPAPARRPFLSGI